MSGIREEFEAWMAMTGRDIYPQNIQHALWIGWISSRAALKVELPDKAQFVEYYEDLEGGTFNWQRYMVAIQEALQQAGIEVK